MELLHVYTFLIFFITFIILFSFLIFERRDLGKYNNQIDYYCIGNIALLYCLGYSYSY